MRGLSPRTAFAAICWWELGASGTSKGALGSFAVATRPVHAHIRKFHVNVHAPVVPLEPAHDRAYGPRDDRVASTRDNVVRCMQLPPSSSAGPPLVGTLLEIEKVAIGGARSSPI